ncbi:phosphatidylglycerol lysyltransferase [Azotobacter beijerinckii]|uniref:Phosphatidylglycerol lysyltransferase n=1 Tax=Azotobacter beijerinckii TaxID=170623 RepID=A0A1H6WQT2_9GAMM|nr:bifunctional lysylphosphatidylglycerol flippase/synthetase MprF [Azotobacter beijerinckii]SEJ15140.1 phosphatidylglycerol lysyltransferase [Azotobacter beijerinckii]
MEITPNRSALAACAKLLQPLAHRLRALGEYRTTLASLFTLLVFGLALIACRRLLDTLDPQHLHQALLAVPHSDLGLALLATAGGYAALLGYEWSACRYAGARLPPSSLLLGGFCAFAIGNSVGLSLLTGGGVRYRLYSRHGLSGTEVAKMSLFASLSLGCTLPLLAAGAALLDLPRASAALHVAEAPLAALAAAVLLGYAVLVLLLWRHATPDAQNPQVIRARLGRYGLNLPGARLSALQLLIAIADMLAAAGVLYVLLPETPPFGSFLLVYLVALAAGVLSHVPGGVGVFEVILLAAFGQSLGTAPLAAALLLYRLIYMVLPLLLACLLLLGNEARRLTRAGLRLASGLAAPVLALQVFIAGIVLLFSGATPSLDDRLEPLSYLVPLQLIELSHLGSSLIGVVCLLLAQGLRRQLSAAWALTLVVLLAAALLSLLKGFDWEESAVLIGTAALLALFRKAFYRPSRLLELPGSPPIMVATLGVLAASTWLLLFVYQDLPYSHTLWWQFELDGNAPRGLRALLASSLALLVLGLIWLLRSPPPPLHAPTPEELGQAFAAVRASLQPEGALALSGDKALLFDGERRAFLMYARRGRSMVALFDPVGTSEQRAELIWQFRDLCDLHHRRPVFYQVRAENLPHYMDIGLIALKLGEEAKVDLRQFDLDSTGKDMKDLRYTWNRGQRDGLSLVFHERGLAPLAELEEISAAWLAGKKVREKGFSLGRFNPDYLQYFRIVVVHHQGRPVAFANLLETDNPEIASLDLMRVHPGAPKLTMEFLMLGVLLHFKARGGSFFSLGMVPLSGMLPRRGAPLPQRLGALVFQNAEYFYNFQGLRRFKEKFNPQWEPRYLAVPAGLDPLLALADTAALIAGGLSGLVKR